MKLLLLVCLIALAAFASDKAEPLFQAIRTGNRDAVQSIVAADPGLVNARGPDGVPAVRLAVYYGHAGIARILLERGAALDLYDAAACGVTGRVRDLLDKEPASVNTLSTDGATPLGLAAFFGHRDAVELLLDRGAAINKLSTNPAFPFAPLHSAMSGGHKEIVDLLLARGADVNVREGGGMTALHEAAAIGSLDYVSLFLAHGATPDAKTDEGKLPEDFARARKHADVAELLRRARGGR
jgi:ankyrin repeat protein